MLTKQELNDFFSKQINFDTCSDIEICYELLNHRLQIYY